MAETLAELQIEGGKLIERINVVIAAFEAKGGDADLYKKYVAAVRGISIDVTDASASMTVINTWMRSDDGGIKWAWTAGRFLAILFAFWIAALLLGRLTARAVQMSSKVSNLLGDFINKSVRRVIMAIGLVVALSALGVDIGPLLAAIGRCRIRHRVCSARLALKFRLRNHDPDVSSV